MTTAITTPSNAKRPRLVRGSNPFLLHRLHSLTGLLFGAYVFIHLLINATLIEGFREGSAQTIYQKQVNRIHSLPFLAPTRWLLIFLPILFHTCYGLWLTWQAKPNVNEYPYGKNIFYAFQRLSALVLAAFIFFHVTALKGWWAASLRFDPTRATESAVSHMSASWFIGWFIYPLGILAASFHLAHGCWTAAITWGITVSSGAQRRWGWVCLVLFVFTLVCGMTAVVAALSPAATARH